MPNPQLENGYTKIANEIMEALAHTNLSSYQSRCLHYLLRKTYGFNKKSDCIALSQWVAGTGIRKQHICRTLNELKERRIVTNSGNEWAFNKKYTEWRALPRQVALPNQVTPVTSSGYKKVPDQGHTKEKKETYTKETPLYPPKFETFWSAYPKKTGKGAALKAWKAIKKPKPSLEQLIASVKKHEKSAQWKKDEGQYIPNPSTWLNQRRWEDEPQERRGWV